MSEVLGAVICPRDAIDLLHRLELLDQAQDVSVKIEVVFAI